MAATAIIKTVVVVKLTLAKKPGIDAVDDSDSLTLGEWKGKQRQP